jgi:crotonobetainyl-CoA:carnitine CoA-transferase CaiB-like acyl-CoA transferase
MPDGQQVATAALPIEFDGRKAGKRLDPQPVGAQTRQVLRGMGLDEARIDTLVRQGIVAG